ncbi:MAG: phage holin family protein [Candidatus Arsenophonus phytopathogenicus]
MRWRKRRESEQVEDRPDSPEAQEENDNLTKVRRRRKKKAAVKKTRNFEKRRAICTIWHRSQEKKWRKTLIDATICAIIAWFARDLLALFGLSAGLVYLASVFIGYLGTDFLGEALTDSLPFRGLRLSVKKPDTRKKNDNQRRRGKSD